VNEATMKLWVEEVYPKLSGKLSSSVILPLGRAYRSGYLIQPIDEVADESLLVIWGIGPKRLAEIRKVIPAPKIASV